MAEQQQQKKPNIFKKLIRFAKDVHSELKKVIWPTRNQVINNTVIVLMVCLLLGGVIWILDAVLGYLYKLVFL
ncbi:MAG: preprotein translocase subunit SecE [Clostridiaceae bacterium]|nr:preprotein translocase subunit SecE [Clostridiaceae bacterium]